MFDSCRGIAANRAENGENPRKSGPIWRFDGMQRFVTAATAKNRYRQRFYSGAAVFQRFKSDRQDAADIAVIR
jgi:hypothetical protein